MRRPYRNVPTEQLQEQHDRLQAKIFSYAADGISLLTVERRELKLLSAELDTRTKAGVESVRPDFESGETIF